jgi:hypothetical protein
LFTLQMPGGSRVLSPTLRLNDSFGNHLEQPQP